MLVAIAAVGAFLAWRSPAWPLGLVALPMLTVSLLGRDPFPHGAFTAALAGWMLVATAFAASRGEAMTSAFFLSLPFLATATLAILLVARLGASDDPSYGSAKVRLFLLVNLVTLIAGAAVGRSHRAFRLYLVVAFGLGAVTALELARELVSGRANQSVGGRITLDQSVNPIGMGREAAMAILIGVMLLLVVRSSFLRLFAAGTLPILLVAFLGAGSRGPVLGLVAGLAVLLAVAVRSTENRRRVVLIAVAGTVGSVLATQLVPGENVQRALSILTGSGSGDQSNGRTALWHAAENAFRAHPILGIGTGGFGAVRPVDLYPHNLFLEVAAELGVVGLVALLALLAAGTAAVVRAFRAAPQEDRSDVALVAALFVAALVNAQFSADITGNDGIWLAVGLAMGFANRYGSSAQPVLEPVLRMRPRRRSAERVRRRSSPEERTQTRWLPQTAPAAAFPGEIIVPGEGAVVGGVVSVAGLPARTGWGVVRVALEVLHPDGEWTEVAEQSGVGFEVVAVHEGVREQIAILRSRRLAELLVLELDAAGDAGRRYEIELSQRRPWDLASVWSLEWDARKLPDGEARIRAVTTDVAGTRVATPVRTLRLDASLVASPKAAQLPRELERDVALDRERRELEAREEAVSLLEQRLAVVERRERELVARAGELAVRERELAERDSARGDLDRHAAEVERLASELENRGRELELRATALSQRERELVARAGKLGARERELADLESVRSELDRRAAELSAREEELAAGAPEPPAAPAEPSAAAPVAVPSPPSAPEPAPVATEPAVAAQPTAPPAPAPPVRTSGADLRLWTLERLVAERPHPDPFVQEEREATLFAVRDHAHVDGTIPPELHALLYDVLGELLT